MSDEIALKQHDVAWASLFECARAELMTRFDPPPLLIEHMGSTAVPGLPAKPVIDVIVLVSDMQGVMLRIGEITALGYEYRPEVSNPERLFFRRFGADRVRTHHLHIHTDAADVARYVLFRDLLRTSDDTRRGYMMLKQDLASRYARDREAYSRGKNDFIDATIARAGGPPRKPFWNS